MKTGLIDVFAFIGTNAAASAMIKDHPSPNRLRVCLGLDAKNPAFVLPSADLDLAVSETILGALSYNGQRCTAIKMVFVHDSVAQLFLPKLVASVDALKMGLPWEGGVRITPLPEADKPNYLKKVSQPSRRTDQARDAHLHPHPADVDVCVCLRCGLGWCVWCAGDR